MNLAILIISFLPSTDQPVDTVAPGRETKTITYNKISVDLVIEKPVNDTADVLIAFHGTVFRNDRILQAAITTLDRVKAITNRKDMLLISVAYPEEGLMMGDNIRESEAALLWVKHKASVELGIHTGKIFLIGHSQGGYIVTRLNTMHTTDGVIANAPGPLNLALRCRLEEENRMPATPVCQLLKKKYGGVTENPGPYEERSLLSFANNFKSDILFVQGMKDSRIQLASWPLFKQKVNECTNCRECRFIEPEGFGHGALFENPETIKLYNEFINR